MASYPSSQPPRRSRKRHKPIARVTSYDVNVRYDLRRKMETKNDRGGAEGLFAAPLHQESYDVMEGETLCSIDKSGAYRDGAIHCFSFCNGLGAEIPSEMKTMIAGPAGELRDAARTLARYIILSKLQLVGVAVTPFYAEKNSHQDMMQGFVANVSGLNTIVNTGDSQIRAGDYVTVDLPTHWKFDDDPFSKHKKAEGIPLDKLLFATRVYTPASAGLDVADLVESVRVYTKNGKSLAGSMIPKIIREIESMITNNGLGSKDLDNEDILRAVAQIVLEVDHLKKRFILGKALSMGRSGEPFDIVLSGSQSL